MKTLSSLVAITLLGVAAVAGAQINMPNPAAPGGSYESAVRLYAPNEIMVDRQIKQWLRKNYPGWDAEPHEFRDLGNERYAIVYITAPNNPGRRVYFRVQKHQNEDMDTGTGFPL